MAQTLLYDFCIMGGLLFISQIIRAHVRFIQKLYIPSALIAGFIGLVCGKYLLNIIPFSDEASSYSGILIAILFSTLFLGNKTKSSLGKMIGSVSDTFLVNTFAEVAQYGVFMVLGGTVFALIFPKLYEGFCLMLPAGFIGGHGTAAAIGSAFAENGWDEATTLGQAFATAGLVSGIVFGVICINIATKRGYTKIIKEAGSLPQEMLTGLIPEEKRESMGQNTVNTMSIDPLCWHLILVLISVGGAYLINIGLKALIPSVSFPVYGLALIVSVLLQWLLRKIKMDQYVDKKVITRIGSTAADFLVGFGVATINLHMVVEYWIPMLVLIVLGLLYCFLFLFVVAPKTFRSYWFERGIYVFGMLTGVMSTGVILLRICDPESQTGVLEDFGIAWMILTFIDILIISLAPLMVVLGYGLWFGIALVVFAVLCLVVNYFLGKNKKLSASETI